MGMMLLFANNDHGQTAPNHMKIARFSSISIVGCSESSNVARRNQSLESQLVCCTSSDKDLLLSKDIPGHEAS